MKKDKSLGAEWSQVNDGKAHTIEYRPYQVGEFFPGDFEIIRTSTENTGKMLSYKISKWFEADLLKIIYVVLKTPHVDYEIIDGKFTNPGVFRYCYFTFKSSTLAERLAQDPQMWSIT